MSETCPNCNRPVLETDATCWHCGYELPQRPKAKPAESPRPPAPNGRAGRLLAAAGERQTSAAQEYDLRAIAVYAALTVLVIVALWLVMNALGRRPILVRSASLAFGSDWVTVSDSELRYALSLPPDWQWLDVGYRDQSELLTTLQRRQGYIARALRPLGDAAGGVEILAVAINAQNLEGTDPLPLVVVGRSPAMRQLAPQQALDLLGEQPLPVYETDIDTHIAGQPQARFTVLDEARAYQCQQLFVADPAATGYLVAACAPQSRYGVMQNDLADILASFQLLQH